MPYAKKKKKHRWEWEIASLNPDTNQDFSKMNHLPIIIKIVLNMM